MKRDLTDDLLSELDALKPVSVTIPKKISFKFKAGKKYMIRDKGNTKTPYLSDYIFTY